MAGDEAVLAVKRTAVDAPCVLSSICLHLDFSTACFQMQILMYISLTINVYSGCTVSPGVAAHW